MNGAGNDFVLVDNRSVGLRLAAGQVARLCDRHRGIGADGVILWVPARRGEAEWAWDFFNSDGSPAEMCGNGARCFARFIRRHTGSAGPIAFETVAGVIRATFNDDQVTVNLTDPEQLRLDETVIVEGQPWTISSLNTGVPHAVLFVPNADEAMVQPLGAAIRRHAHFAPRGTNVNFVQVLGPGRIRVRTYERGVEGETLACGTGVTASALVAARRHGFTAPVEVRVQGGETLTVDFQTVGDGFRSVHLTGPADFVFTGQFEL